MTDEFQDLDEVIEPVIASPAEVIVPPRIPTDDEIQAALSNVALGLRLSVRMTVGNVTDTFVNGGDFAPGRSRWVQTKAFDSAEVQAAVIAASLS